MTAFLIACACLVAGALLFLLPPLLKQRASPRRLLVPGQSNLSVYRDQLAELKLDLDAGTLSADQYEHSRRELERRTLEEVDSSPPTAAAAGGKWLAALVGAAVPVLALLLYLQLGSPALIASEQTTAPGGAPHAMDMRKIQQMVDGLAQRLAANPQDADGWIMLARSYTVLGRHADAAIAYGRAVELRPNDAQLLADYADTLAFTQGKRLAGRPAELIRRALQVDPGNVKALALAGTEAYERSDYVAAGDYWERLLKLVPAGSDLEESVRANVREARALQAGRSSTTPEQTQPTSRASGAGAPAGAKIAGSVRLSPKLAASASPRDTVFVFARAIEGPRMPLAILRMQVKDLPAAFVLDDSLAMSGGATLSRFREVVVGARVSRSGGAMPQAGDLQGIVQPVAVGAAGVQVVIDEQVR